MSKPAQKALTLLLSVLLTICWVVGEAWHLVPGMAHLEEYRGGCLVVGAAPCKTMGIPVYCDHEGVQHQSPCPLKILSVEQCPICRTLSQHNVICATQALRPLPELVHVRPVDQSTCFISAATHTSDARAPPVQAIPLHPRGQTLSDRLRSHLFL